MSDVVARAENLLRCLNEEADDAPTPFAKLALGNAADVVRDLIHAIGTERQRVLALQYAYLDETHGDRDPSTVGPEDIAGLRTAFREQGEAIRDLVPVVEAAERWRTVCDPGTWSREIEALSAEGEDVLDTVDVLRAKRGQS